jgi:hypothetical protein
MRVSDNPVFLWLDTPWPFLAGYPVSYIVSASVPFLMRSYNMPQFVAALLVISILCIFFTGCTSLQNVGQPPVATPVPTPNATEPVITTIVTTIPATQVLPTEPVRKQQTDTEFLFAFNESQEKVLGLITSINSELVKDSIRNTSPDYTALGSFARNLGTTADEEIAKISKFREISEPANESLKAYYVNYLTGLKPFAANLNTGAGLAQKKDFSTASMFFSNAKNDLALIEDRELPGHFRVTTQIQENLSSFLDMIQQQKPYPV